jgi:hypothetical protein
MVETKKIAKRRDFGSFCSQNHVFLHNTSSSSVVVVSGLGSSVVVVVPGSGLVVVVDSGLGSSVVVDVVIVVVVVSGLGSPVVVVVVLGVVCLQLSTYSSFSHLIKNLIFSYKNVKCKICWVVCYYINQLLITSNTHSVGMQVQSNFVINNLVIANYRLLQNMFKK